ncbi:FHA domain-containing protein [Streptacidiphilus sp. N1-10]|uniref:FHA domain-containing protein n=1 Tax=Streptacidiphilus jeojiensis TaxID=3229225 RepID=A0ABV6Y1A0_9ACTN
MQIRLSVLAARDGAAPSRAHADVLVTAPVGTALGAVAVALAGAVAGRPGARGTRSATHVHLYAGDQRLDERAVLGHPPLVDGAVLRLDEPDPDHVPDTRAGSPTELRVVGGPDAGGIHLLLPGRVRVGRSAEADVPLDDPDVSRFHLSLDVAADGRVSVADLDSTNGTALDGLPVGPEPVPVPPGSVIGLGESALVLTAGGGRPGPLGGSGLLADGQGQLQLTQRPAAPPPPAAPRLPGGPTATGTGSSPVPKPSAGRTRGLLARGGERLLRGGRSALRPPVPPPVPAGPRSVPGPGATPPHGLRLAPAPGLRRADAGRWPDPAELLHTALGPGPRLWERGPEHPDTLALRLGTVGPHAAPVTLDLRGVGSLGLSGPQPRLAGLARALVAQLAVLHGPAALELVLISADPARPAELRAQDWSWAFWLPQLRPLRGQSCRLLTALDPEQALARLAELGAAGGSAAPRACALTVLVVDGDPGSTQARAALGSLLAHGPAQGVHVIALAERPDLLPHGCGATAAIGGEVDTLLTLERPAERTGPAAGGQHRAAPAPELVDGIALDAVSAAWAERLARGLAPLREPDGNRRPGRGALPDAPRLLDLLGLDLVTPAKLASRWEDLQVASGALPAVLVGADRDGACGLDLASHLLIGGAPGSGRTELLRTLLASLSVAERPDRLGVMVIEGRPPRDPADGLLPCTELPQVTDYVDGSDPQQLLHAAQGLLGELDRRELLLQGRSFASWHAERALARLAPPRRAADDYPHDAPPPGAPSPARVAVDTAPPAHLLVVVDDHDELLLPGRERAALAAALDTVAVRGPRLGVHLAVATGRPDRSSGTELDEAAHLRIALRTDDSRLSSLLIHVDDAAAVPEDRPGRGWIRYTDGGVTAFQGARVSGRIPRTATLRPTVAPIDWAAMGDPPARRPVRELGNGPTDLALLASALQRAAETAGAGGAAGLL